MADIEIKPYSSSVWYRITDLSFLQCNWEVSRAGMLSASLTVRQMEEFLKSLPSNGDGSRITTLAGMIVRYEDPSAGRWAGQVVQYGGANGTISISAMTYEVLLRKKVIAVDTSGQNDSRRHPGTVLKGIIEKYNDGSEGIPRVRLTIPSPPTTDLPFTTETPGNNVDVKLKTQADAYDEIIPQLTEDIGWEWNVDADLNVTYDRDLGRDLSSSVTLTEGEEVVSANWQDDFLSVTNSLIGFYTKETPIRNNRGKITKYLQEQDKIIVDTATSSISQFGTLRERRDYPDITNADSLRKQLRLEISVSEEMRPSITVEVANVNNVWSKFRHGDTVFLNLRYSGYLGKFRVMVRSLDVNRGVMVLSGYGETRVG